MAEAAQLQQLFAQMEMAERSEIRVRQIITSLSYSDLVRQGIIPDLRIFHPAPPAKRYPPWIYQRSKTDADTFSSFGLFIEDVIFESTQSPSLTKERLGELWSHVFNELPPDQLYTSFNFFLGIFNTFRQAFQETTGVEHEPSLSCEHFSGHPDLFHSNWILDVKTTVNFSKMAEESFLQILSYLVLARMNGHSPSAIGILLPLQRQILWYGASDWDSSKFQEVLIRSAKWTRQDQGIYNPMMALTEAQSLCPDEQIHIGPNIVESLGAIVQSEYLGSHFLKESDYPTNIPVQIYLSNPRPGENQGHLSTEQIQQLEIKCQGVILYIHANLNINLSISEEWPVTRLKDQLMISRRIGARGVVVHVGKAKELSIEQAKINMISNLRSCIEAASPECPILIETPAGQGTELCPVLEELAELYSQFTEEERIRIKICIDTCHVFAAGYNPIYYLKTWQIKFPGTVGLIHFNDSKTPRGSRKDRHYYPGLGYIGFKRLWKVHQYCVANSIHMVRE